MNEMEVKDMGNTVNFDIINKVKSTSEQVAEITTYWQRGVENTVEVGRDSNVAKLIASTSNLEQASPGFVKSVNQLVEALDAWSGHYKALEGFSGN
jgi:predicted metal-dependent phosphotriesterase family hydrolase